MSHPRERWGNVGATDLPVDGATIAGGSAPDMSLLATAKTRPLKPLTLADIDRRTRAYQSADRLLCGLLSDLGGEANASVGQRELAQRAAVLGAMIEDTEARWLRGESITLADYLAAVNAHRRVLATIGLERRARDATPTLDHYLAREPTA